MRSCGRSASGYGRSRAALAARGALLLLFLLFAWAPPAIAAGRLTQYLEMAQPGELFEGADRFGEVEGDPPVAPIYRGQELLGYVYLNSDVVSAIGYSGKPIHILVGIDPSGVVRGLKLVQHQEPIVLIGIPEERVVAAVNQLIGEDLGRIAASGGRPPQVDIVSGATVTVLVMGDSIVRSAVRLIRTGRIGTIPDTIRASGPTETRELDLSQSELRDWETLIGDGSVRSLRLTVGEVTDEFRRGGFPQARPESRDPDERFIELYIAPVSVPTIGRSLLGDVQFERLRQQLNPGQHAIVVAGDGAYSFKGSGYVRGGIFDRIELIQNGQGIRFRDRNHTRLGDLAAEGAPRLREIALYVVPEDFEFEVTEPWELQLLVQREISSREKANISYELGYSLPDEYVTVIRTAEPVPQSPVGTAGPVPDEESARPGASLVDGAAEPPGEEEPLWQRIWKMNTVSIGITVAALLVLTGIFFFQDWFVRRPVLYAWVRRGYLAFTLFWLGWYANAQLSVVNVLTFTNSLISNFSWEFFLAAPLIFILWAAVAVGLLFWGRGPFCGWLCPFGALQELTNNIAQWLKVPQIKVPFGLHERLWPIKYIIFLGLFGLSFYSMSMAEVAAEVEPFKTAIILKFVRDWPFVVFALGLLAIGLFVERFYCRYLCPLGAALAIPGRIRMFEWLKRWPECGTPCQRCAKDCPVQSIHPEGQINVNECIYCMNCQVLYYDDQRCPHMIQVRLKREKFEALSSPSMKGKGPANPVISHKGVPIERPDTVTRPTT